MFTLVVAPGTGASVVTTEPCALRPDNGMGAACEPPGPLPPWATAFATTEAVTRTLPASTRSKETVRIMAEKPFVS